MSSPINSFDQLLALVQGTNPANLSFVQRQEILTFVLEGLPSCRLTARLRRKIDILETMEDQVLLAEQLNDLRVQTHALLKSQKQGDGLQVTERQLKNARRDVAVSRRAVARADALMMSAAREVDEEEAAVVRRIFRTFGVASGPGADRRSRKRKASSAATAPDRTPPSPAVVSLRRSPRLKELKKAASANAEEV